jgi:hypothetical protein
MRGCGVPNQEAAGKGLVCVVADVLEGYFSAVTTTGTWQVLYF